MKNPKTPTYKCVICRKEFTGYGNNPRPVLFHGRCCDKCNRNVVIPFRMLIISKNQNND